MARPFEEKQVTIGSGQPHPLQTLPLQKARVGRWVRGPTDFSPRATAS